MIDFSRLAAIVLDNADLRGVQQPGMCRFCAGLTPVVIAGILAFELLLPTPQDAHWTRFLTVPFMIAIYVACIAVRIWAAAHAGKVSRAADQQAAATSFVAGLSPFMRRVGISLCILGIAVMGWGYFAGAWQGKGAVWHAQMFLLVAVLVVIVFAGLLKRD